MRIITMADGDKCCHLRYSIGAENTSSIFRNTEASWIVLDNETIEDNVFFLAPNSSGTTFVFVQVCLRGFNLTNIDALGTYTQLQIVDLSCNKLTDLRALSNMPHLKILNVSWNLITKILDFDPPLSLRKAFYGNNSIESIPNLYQHWALQSLDLNHNKIEEIEGLLQCKCLTSLSMKDNRLQKIQNLNPLPLRFLNLSGNYITGVKEIKMLLFLEELHLSENRIRTLKHFKNLMHLKILDMHTNHIRASSEIGNLQGLSALRELDLRQNLITSNEHFQLKTIFLLKNLKILNGNPITLQEKIAANEIYSQQYEIKALKDHLLNRIYGFFQPMHVRPSTTEWGRDPRIIVVLVGPAGSGKGNLVSRIANEGPGLFGKCTSYTTRAPRSDDIPDVTYHFISMRAFENWHQNGQFLETASLYGEKYGLTWESVNRVSRAGFICITHMELEGALSLKHTHFQTNFIFVMPGSDSIHERRLETMKSLHMNTVKEVLKRRTLYMNYHHNNPGFYMRYINSDDTERAFDKISHVIGELLNVKEESYENFRISSHWKPEHLQRSYSEMEKSSLIFRRKQALKALQANNSGLQHEVKD